MPRTDTPDAPVVSDAPAAADTAEDKPDFVAKTAIFINGVRAYNPGDRVSANAVKNNKLDEFVRKP